jgi:hypothetical protein
MTQIPSKTLGLVIKVSFRIFGAGFEWAGIGQHNLKPLHNGFHDCDTIFLTWREQHPQHQADSTNRLFCATTIVPYAERESKQLFASG